MEAPTRVTVRLSEKLDKALVAERWTWWRSLRESAAGQDA